MRRVFPRAYLSRLAGVLLAATAIAIPAAATAQPTAQPKYGGTVVVGMIGNDADTLDPTVSMAPLSVQTYVTFCKRLYERDDKQNLVPVLASGQPIYSKDRLSYAVNLRRGVKFNDGTPMTAQAVVSSVERLMYHERSSRKSDFDSVQSVNAVGQHTVVFHLKAKDAAFQGNPWVFSPTQLQKAGDGFGASPICAGPYMFDGRVPGDSITVKKSPWWFDREKVYLDKIVYRPMANQPAALAALKAGDIQAVDQVSWTDLSGIQDNAVARACGRRLLPCNRGRRSVRRPAIPL